MSLDKSDYILAGFTAAAAIWFSTPAEACDCPINLSMPKTPHRAVPAAVTAIPDRVVAPVAIPAARAPNILVQTIQHRPVDVAVLDFEGAHTLIAAKEYFREHINADARLDACIEGDADPSQTDNYNIGLSTARASETAKVARDLDLNVVRQFPFGEFRAAGPDNRLLSESRRTITYIGLPGVFGNVSAAPNCFQAAYKNDKDIVLHYGAPFVSPRHETARDGEFRAPVRDTYVPKGMN